MDRDLSTAINSQAHAIAHSAQLQLRADLRARAYDLLDQGLPQASVIDAIRKEGASASHYTLHRRDLSD